MGGSLQRLQPHRLTPVIKEKNVVRIAYANDWITKDPFANWKVRLKNKTLISGAIKKDQEKDTLGKVLRSCKGVSLNGHFIVRRIIVISFCRFNLTVAIVNLSDPSPNVIYMPGENMVILLQSISVLGWGRTQNIFYIPCEKRPT